MILTNGGEIGALGVGSPSNMMLANMAVISICCRWLGRGEIDNRYCIILPVSSELSQLANFFRANRGEPKNIIYKRSLKWGYLFTRPYAARAANAAPILVR